MGSKNLSYKITTEPRLLECQNDNNLELLDNLRYYHQMALRGKKSSIKKLLNAIEKYPDVPQFKNYLSVLYRQLDDAQKLYDVNKWIIAEHPDYLFGKLNLASEYYSKQEYDKIPDVLGHEMDLGSLYPNRETFHLNEVTAFLSTTILYYAAIENLEEAEMRYDLLEDLAPDSQDTEMALHHLLAARMEAEKRRFDKEQKTRISVTTSPQEVSTVSQQPKFHHEEIKDLYTHGLYIKRELLEAILSLPRETLIQDLELILQDSINRYSYFQNIDSEDEWEEETMNFVIHAIFILGELKSTASIDTIFKVLSQSEEYLDLYLDDFVTELLWEPLYKIAADKLQACKAFLFRPGIGTYAKAVIFDMVEQIALYHPERKDELISWFGDVIQFFLSSEISDNVIDSDLIALMICNVINIEGDNLMPEIEKMFQKGIVSTGICGHWSDVSESLTQPDMYDYKEDILTIFDRYNEVTTIWSGYDESEIYFDYDLYDSTPQPIKTEPKIGRNESCPCGSGKKYKKCCINN